ncbi:MAG: glycosyl hydrolase family 8, partial [Pontiellaceae bacterium]|nr:glycosyl hydrolase family 8 [Pontiellaceae bacterium]
MNAWRAGIMMAGIRLFAAGVPVFAAENFPFPQADSTGGSGLRPSNMTQAQLNAAVADYYIYWKDRYLAPSTTVAGDYKVNCDGTGATVSEAMGYGMLLTVYMAGADTNAKVCFDGLNRFRKRYPSSIDPVLMCWTVPANEISPNDDCATDGDLDMAMALLLAYRQWGDPAYFTEATNYLRHIASSLVRSDFSLRLGDWNSAAGQTRPSDFMPAAFRSFYLAAGDGIWTNVENKCYEILAQLQINSAPATGLVPDFAVTSGGNWIPASANFLEGPHDGHYYYNACRVPWRIGWSAWFYGDDRARQILSRFMDWTVSHHTEPVHFRAGCKLDGSSISGSGYDTACFISPTGVAAMTTTNQVWLNSTFNYAAASQEEYYEDSVNLLSMLVMSGNAWLLTTGQIPRFTQITSGTNNSITLTGECQTGSVYQIFATTNLSQPF